MKQRHPPMMYGLDIADAVNIGRDRNQLHSSLFVDIYMELISDILGKPRLRKKVLDIFFALNYLEHKFEIVYADLLSSDAIVCIIKAFVAEHGQWQLTHCGVRRSLTLGLE